MRTEHICRRLILRFFAPALVCIGAPAAAQQTQSTWSFTAGVGLAAPLGAWRSDLEAGREYRLAIGRTRNGSAWTFELELATHPFDFGERGLAARNDGSVRGYIRQTSLGFGVRRLLTERQGLSSWLSGGVALHSVRTSTWVDGPLQHTSLRDEFVPGANVGLGVAFGGLRLQPVLDARLRYVLLGERPLLSVPIALSLRF